MDLIHYGIALAELTHMSLKDCTWLEQKSSKKEIIFLTEFRGKIDIHFERLLTHIFLVWHQLTKEEIDIDIESL